MESLLVEAEVLSLQTRRPFRKGHNFSSIRWITLDIVEEFSDAGFHGLDVESQLVRRRSRRSRPEYRIERAITFDPTVVSPSKL